MRKLLLPVLIASLSFSTVKAQNTNLIPYPQSLQQTDGTLKIPSGNLSYKLEGFSSDRLNKRIQEDLFNSGIKKISTKKASFLTITENKSLAEEAYTLQISKEGIRISASTESGALWGLETLQQLYRLSENSGEVPLLSIEDAPQFQWRGMHLDVARHFFPKEYLFKIIDLLADYKFNKFHLHLTDDEGWRIEIKKYPKLTENGAWRTFDKNDQAILQRMTDNPDFYLPQSQLRTRNGKTEYGGFYTQQDIREIVAYATSKNIEVVPEIDMPGHMSAAIKNYPEQLLDGIEPGWGKTFSIPINPCQESSYTFVENVLDEVMALFPSRYIHLGADEVEKSTWLESQKCKNLMAEKGFKDVHDLQSHFVLRVDDYLKKHGKTAIGWDEILDGPSDPEMAVMYWRGWEKNNPEKAAAQGHPIIMTPNNPLYFDYQPNAGSVESVYRFNVIPEDIPENQKHLFLGAQANVWTEMIPSPERVEFMILPRLIALSERVWTNKSDFPSFEKRLLNHYNLWNEKGLHYRQPDLSGFTDTQVIVEGKSILNVQSPLAGNRIYYTTDGTLPGLNSSQLAGPLTVTKPGEIRLATIASSGAKSEIYKVNFIEGKWNQAVQPTSPKKGLQGVFYAGHFPDTKGITGEVLKTETLPNAALPETIKLPSFGLKESGFLKVPEKGIYNFYLTADDGAVLRIADQLVVDNDGQHSAVLKSGQVALEAGYHPFELHFIEAGGGYTLRLSYSVNGSEPKAVPDDWFFHSAE